MDPSLHVRMTERRHHSFLLALKSRVLVVSKERRRKAKTLGLLALQKSYLFRCFFALRAARHPFRHQSSQHFLLSLFYIFSAVFVSTTKVVERLIFIHFGLGPLFGFILCRAKNFPLFPSSLSLSLSLSIIYTYIYEKKLKKSSSKPVVVV